MVTAPLAERRLRVDRHSARGRVVLALVIKTLPHAQTAVPDPVDGFVGLFVGRQVIGFRL